MVKRNSNGQYMRLSLFACNRKVHFVTKKNLRKLIKMHKIETKRKSKTLFKSKCIYNCGKVNKICAVCVSANADTILSCGHYILCSSCLSDVLKSGGMCPMCRRDIQYDYPCYTISDMKDYKCCHKYSEKENKICMPCGHFHVACKECGEQIIKTQTCPVCNEDINAYLPFFNS